MTDDDLAARLRAVERAVTDGDAAVVDLSDAAAVHDRLDDLERDVAALAERVDALDATVQSLHGYVGELEHVNERVERRADAARAAVERFEDDCRRSGTGSPDDRIVGTLDEQSAGDTRDDTRVSGRRSESGDRASRPDAQPRDDAENSLLERVRNGL